MSTVFKIGDRVRLVAPSPIVSLRADTGTITQISDVEGYWVELDAPASYQSADGRVVELPVIREREQNLEPAP